MLVLTESNSKTKSVSFRLPEEIVELLETESSIKNVNVSTLLSQICRNYFGYEGKTGKAGLVAFPRPLLMRLMEGYPELGRNWSLYLGHLYKNVIEELAEKKVAVNVTDKSVMFRF